MLDNVRVQKFQEGITNLSFTLEGNLNHLKEVTEKLKEIKLNKSHNQDFSEIGFLLFGGIIGFVGIPSFIELFGLLKAGLIVFLYYGLLYFGYTVSFGKRKDKFIDTIHLYIQNKENLLNNMQEIFILLHKYLSSNEINPSEIEKISHLILQYTKNIRDIYRNFQKINSSRTSALSEYQGFRKYIKSFLLYEENIFPRIIDGFNMIFEFWIETHISKIQSYQSKLITNIEDKPILKDTLLISLARMDKNIEMFENIEKVKN